MSRRVYLVTILILLVCCTGATFAQTEEPSWLLLERGEILFEEREFGDALRIFREILARDQINPEPHYWVGRIFEEEGELDLAEQQYHLALDYRRELYVLESEYQIRERLARLYKIRGDYARFEEALLEIINLDEEFNSPQGIARQTALSRLIADQGLDKVMELYRIDRSASFIAHAELGLFYYRTGRYRDAVLHLLYGGLTVLTRTIEYQRIEEPFYEFEGVAGLIRLAREDEENRAYLNEMHLDALLYYLGASLYAAGEPQVSNEIMELVRTSFADTPWSRRALSQLADPYIEPVITAEEFFYFF